jgi:hypothetical protein
MNCLKCKLEENTEKKTYSVSSLKGKRDVSSSLAMVNNNVNVGNFKEISNSCCPTGNINPVNTFIGIDIGKFFIDVYCSLNGKYYLKIKNEEKSIIKLIKTIKSDLNINAFSKKKNTKKNNNNNINNNNTNNTNNNKVNNTNGGINNNSNSLNNILVVIDLTGNYEILCRDIFYNNGFTNIHLADGKKIKYFKKSKGNSIAKTDKSDAFILAL